MVSTGQTPMSKGIKRRVHQVAWRDDRGGADHAARFFEVWRPSKRGPFTPQASHHHQHCLPTRLQANDTVDWNRVLRQISKVRRALKLQSAWLDEVFCRGCMGTTERAPVGSHFESEALGADSASVSDSLASFGLDRPPLLVIQSSALGAGCLRLLICNGWLAVVGLEVGSGAWPRTFLISAINFLMLSSTRYCQQHWYHFSSIWYFNGGLDRRTDRGRAGKLRGKGRTTAGDILILISVYLHCAHEMGRSRA